jgi:hypothetical protein
MRVTAAIALLLAIAATLSRHPPTPDLGPGVVTALALVIVLALSGEFSKITIGSFLALKREAKLERRRASAYRSQVRDLRASIASLTASMQQIQTTTTRIHNGDVYVREARPESVKTEEAEELEAESAQEQPSAVTSTPVDETPKQDPAIALQDDIKRRALQIAVMQHEAALKRFATSIGVPETKLVSNAQIKAQVSIDPISSHSPLFDAYLERGSEEFFIEVVTSTPDIYRLRLRLYELIAKVYRYRQLSKNEVRLVTIIVPELRQSRVTPEVTQTRLSELFAPAVASRLVEFRIDASAPPAVESSEDPARRTGQPRANSRGTEDRD